MISHYLFNTENDTESLRVAILIKDSAFNYKDIYDNYIKHLDIPANELVAFNLKYVNDKISAKEAKEYLLELLEGMNSLGITTLYVADSTYFKYLTKVKKTSNCHGDIFPVALHKDYEHMSCILGVNHRACLYDPKQQDTLISSLLTLESYHLGSHKKQEIDIKYEGRLNFISYIELGQDIRSHGLLSKPTLAIDIEAWGPDKEKKDALRFNKNTLESIAFAWSNDSGYAALIQGDKDCLNILKQFFIDYTGKCVYHNGLFDIKHLIYHLFMSSPDDFEGMFEGIRVMTKHIDDTMIMTYLCTNSTAGNTLGLKENTQEFTGNYAEDVTDVRALPVGDLLKYNLIDTLATYWLYEQRNPQLDIENQRDIYTNIFMPSYPVLLEMMLTGLPMDMNRVHEVRHEIEQDSLRALDTIDRHPLVKKAVFNLKVKELNKVNAKLKKKVKALEDISIDFNPGSNIHKAELLYNTMELPVLDTTDSGDPSCSGKTLKKLLNHCSSELDKELLQAFIDYLDSTKILGTFIKAFIDFEFTRFNTSWLNGNQKLGGTLSGRLASSDPNLANLPSNSRYAKPIKSCFVAPKGWLFFGSDYSALEDRVVAILSQDPNKVRIFSEGIDGHCLNAYGYYSDQMPDIDPNDPKSINSIKDKYPELRQESKASTFALNYGGSSVTLHHNNGLPMDQAIQVEAGHKEMYKVLHAWGESNKQLMTTQGYLSCAYELKVRTPMLAASLLNSKITPTVTKAEFRSANNAGTQSHGLMTTVAGTNFKSRLDTSEHRYSILCTNFIHDAIYGLVKKTPEAIKYLNDTLIDCMIHAGDNQVKAGQDVVPIEAELDLGPSWDKQHTLKNNMTLEEIEEFLKDL